MEFWTITAALAQIVATVAIVFAAFQFVGDRTQRHREFENLYVQRYWHLQDKMSNTMYIGGTSKDEDDHRNTIAYLRLCEDEIELRELGFITDRTWGIWKVGISNQLKSGFYFEILEALDDGDLPNLRNFLRNNNDPLTWNWLHKWWSGLI